MSIVVQIWHGASIDKYDECMKNVEDSAIEYGHTYHFISLYEIPFMESAVAMQRIMMAKEIDEMIYVDADITDIRWDEIPTDGPAFGFYKGIPDYSIFAVNGHTEFFENILTEKEDRGLLDHSFWPRKILREKKVTRIPDSAYKHERITGHGRKNTDRNSFKRRS